MARRMPAFHNALAAASQEALGIVAAGELSRTSHPKEWHVRRLEALYELAFLRIFGAWEMYLEAVFLRSLCGYESSAGQETLQGTLSHFPNLLAAEAAMLGGQQFKLWHNPGIVVKRCQGFIKSNAPGCPALQETTISSNLTYLGNLAAIRHRIAHTQNDAKTNFDNACTAIAARTYRGARPGRLLRDWDKSATPHCRWISTFERSLVGLLGQMI